MSGREFVERYGEKGRGGGGGRVGRRHKYNAQRTQRGGVTFASKAEADRWEELKLLEGGGAIVHVQRQVTFRLGCDENRYLVDFLVWNTYGEAHAEDVKGLETAAFKRHARLWRRYGPCDLHILKRKGAKWATQVIRGYWYSNAKAGA